MKVSQLLHAMDKYDTIIIDLDKSSTRERPERIYIGSAKGIKRDDPINKMHVNTLCAINDKICCLVEKPRFKHENVKEAHMSKEKKKRKYYRKCGVCGERYEQSEMIRTNNSPNGWICFDCHNAEHPEYEDFGEV